MWVNKTKGAAKAWNEISSLKYIYLSIHPSICMQSINANTDILENIKLVPITKKVAQTLNKLTPTHMY